MKKTVGVVFGGQSAEHDVSLMSATNVIEAIDREKFDIITIGITKNGEWMIYTGPYSAVRDGSWEKDEENLIKDFAINNPHLKKIDVFFPVLHGPMGEDGTVQGLFELTNKPYVGCGVLASAVGMDKVYTKIIFEKAGIPQVKYDYFTSRNWESNQEEIIERIEKKFDYPVFIKPSNMGSSLGISKAHSRQELIEGINTAAEYDSKVLVEDFIDCREIECAVIGNEEPTASVLGEILPSNEFYDYTAKYFDGGKSRLSIPAAVEENVSDQIRSWAVAAFKAVDGSGLARVDFFIDRPTGRIYINEINTLPGFTNISMYPKLLEYSGLSYSGIIERLIDLAIERFNYKCKKVI